jgi:branched-subunit amino acid aminotransferase/4-amino-4-deoxychorismate lyase
VPPPDIAPTAILTARAIPAGLDAERARGVAVVLLPFGHGRGGATSGHKNVDYLAAVAGRMRAARRGAAEALFVETDGTIDEGTTSNLFLVRRGALHTPPVAAGCLPGITRQTVVRAALRAGLAVRERPVRPADVAAADEVFLTGSVVEVLPVVRIDGRRVASGRPGAVTQRVQGLYRAVVDRALQRRAT